MGTKWKMPIAVIGKPTGDSRQFDEGALSHRDLPLPLRYVASDAGGHANATIVGHISKIGKEKDGLLPAEGEFYDDESWPEDVRDGATAARMFTEKKVIGPSVDLDQAEMERVPEPKAYAAWKKEQGGKLKAAKMNHGGGDCGCGSPTTMAEEVYGGPMLKMVRSGRIASATLVHIPAFAELAGHATLTPIDSHDPNVAGTTSSAYSDKIENDAELSAEQGEEMASKKKKLDPEKVQGNRDDEELADGSGIWLSDVDYQEFAKKRLPRPSNANKVEAPTDDVEQSGPGAVYRDMAPNVGGGVDRDKISAEDFVDPDGRRFPIVNCGDVADAVSSYGRAKPQIPFAKFKARLTAIARRKGCADSLPDNWKSGEKMAALIAAADTAFKPPAAAFANPQFTGPRALEVDEATRTVRGHVAVWDTCHVGIGDSCVTPPKSRAGYAYFHTGEVVTAEGERVAVGRLSYGGGHAAGNLGYRAAAEHYDDTTHMAALVRAGEDEYGIWVAGVLTPEADEATVRTMRATPLSGDWRRIGGNLEMVAALHVNTAGFPVPRAVISSGEPYALVAAGALHPVAHEEGHANAAPVDAEALGRAIAREMVAEQRRLAVLESEWPGLVAAATKQDNAAGYDQAMGDLINALIE